MDAVILAAGEGSRMRPLTSSRPKVMLPLANRPIIEHLLSNLIEAECERIVMVIGYRAERVREHFGDGEKWGVAVDYCYQTEPSGTADAIARVKNLVKERFLVVNGDSIFRPDDLRRLMSLPGAGIGLIEVADTAGLGVVTIDGDRISHIYEKVSRPPTKLANAGAYLFTPEVFDAVENLAISDRGEYELPAALEKMIEKGGWIGWNRFESWMTFSYPWDLLSGCESLVKPEDFSISGTLEPGVVIKGALSLGKGSTLHSGSCITGPAVIGEGCEIGPNCFIRPFTSIGDDCHIGASVEIKNSIIMSGTRIPHLTYIGDSVIGEGCNFGAGTQVANLRFDNRDIRIGNKDTGRRKLGAIIGDGVQTGINASINAGCVIGAGCIIGPGALASGVYEPGSRIL
ncbi:MAG: NTP transferase domain-containing protein [Dehalococcoidaceae bacterium]|nr:NTP transferase domain-containing protein [Dehalococcoidaceae bacterium]